MMALLARDRRVSRSEFTRDFYRPSSSITTPSPLPTRRQDQARGDTWRAPPFVNPAVWRASHSAKLHDARASTSLGERTRAENRRLCDETGRLTANQRREADHRLEERFGDVTFWREELASRHATLDQDAAALKVLRDRLAKAHHLYLQPLDVAHRCIELRRGRVGVEEVEDEASKALRQEVEELTRCRDALARTLADADQQVRRVLSCRYHLERNLQDKDAALRVDETASRLTPTAPPTDIIPGQAIDPSPVLVESWREAGMKLLSTADDEHQLSQQILALAEDILVATSRHARERLEHTDHCLQERILDTRRAKTLLEEEHAKLVEEESRLEQSLEEVEDQLREKRGPLALAQTRLHTRGRRPNMERTRDAAEDALLREVGDLEASIDRLASAAELTRRHLRRLGSARVALEHDINLKAKTLLIDEVRAMGLRSTVKIDTY